MLRLILVLLLTLLALIVGCAPQPAPPEGARGFDPTLIIFLIAIFAVFYFLMIRPQRRRQREHEALMQELQKGDKIITAGGIYGEIESIEEHSIVMKVESGASLRVAKGSILGKRSEK